MCVYIYIYIYIYIKFSFMVCCVCGRNKPGIITERRAIFFFGERHFFLLKLVQFSSTPDARTNRTPHYFCDPLSHSARIPMKIR